MIDKITESSSNYDDLEKMSTAELLYGINSEDSTVAEAVKRIIPSIEKFVDACYKRMAKNGRLFYIGAGTSGRLGIVDASECPPTFGVDHGLVIGIMAGGDGAIRRAVFSKGLLGLQEIEPVRIPFLFAVSIAPTT